MAGAVEEERRITGKTKKKTNIFWSTVPVNEQFRNVRVPGVDLEVSAKNKTNLKRHEPVQSVRKSKSDPGVSSSHVDLLTSGKNAGTIIKIAEKRQEIKRENTGALKGDVSNIVNISSSSSRRASIKNLTIEDKKRVANLIKELAKTGEERELALERLQEERVSFEERLCTVQEEQASLRLERDSLQGELKEGQELLKKYETELEVVKRQKEEQDLILNKQTVVSAQCTQTTPVVMTSPHTSTESDRAPYDTKHPPEGRLPSEIPQLPVYSNSLYDLKTCKVEQPVRSSGKSVEDVQPSNDGGYGRSGVAESLDLHTLTYLREYKLQLCLQEQQLEVQRQQIMLQQHLQMLQQMPNQTHEPQHGNTKEPLLIQHAGLGHTTNQAQFVEEIHEVPQGTQGPFVQQQSRGNVGQDFASHHSSQTDQLLQEPQNSWSHRSQVINGVPMQSNHFYRASEDGNGTQPVSHNFQKISERNQQCDHLMDHHRTLEPNNHQAQYHHVPEHIGEQYPPAESYHQPNGRLYLPVSSPQQTNDMYLPEPQQHGHQLDRKNVLENYCFGKGVHDQFDIEHHRYPPENSARQSQQSYCQSEEHIDAMKAKGLHPTEYHRQQSKQSDFSTEQHRSLMNKYRSPTERHSNTKPYTRQGYRLPAQNTYHSSEFNNEHNLRESLYSHGSYSDPIDMAHSMARQKLFSSAAGQHSPRKETSLNHASDVPTDHNDNVQPNPRHWYNCTSNHQSFSSDATHKTSPTWPHADHASSRYVNAEVPLDQYISNYQNFNGYSSPHVKSNKADGLTVPKRKMDPKDAFDVVEEHEVGMQSGTDRDRRKTTYGNREQIWIEKQDLPLSPDYSLYKTDIETLQSPKNRRRSSIPTSDVQLVSQNYPNSLIQIVENLEDDNEAPSPDFRLSTHTVVLNSDEEENDVLDDIFFSKAINFYCVS